MLSLVIKPWKYRRSIAPHFRITIFPFWEVFQCTRPYWNQYYKTCQILSLEIHFSTSNLVTLKILYIASCSTSDLKFILNYRYLLTVCFKWRRPVWLHLVHCRVLVYRRSNYGWCTFSILEPSKVQLAYVSVHRNTSSIHFLNINSTFWTLWLQAISSS